MSLVSMEMNYNSVEFYFYFYNTCVSTMEFLRSFHGLLALSFGGGFILGLGVAAWRFRRRRPHRIVDVPNNDLQPRPRYNPQSIQFGDFQPARDVFIRMNEGDVLIIP